MWVARSKCGTLELFCKKPVRYDAIWVDTEDDVKVENSGKIIYNYSNAVRIFDNQFKDLKWEDEPVRVKIVKYYDKD